MEKGVSKYWTPEQEEFWSEQLKECHTFAQRAFVMSLRDVLKYDFRTKEGKRAAAQARLRLATATDEDLKEMAELEAAIAFRAKLLELRWWRGRIREKGIKRSELECQ